MKQKISLIAHDARKAALVAWVVAHEAVLAKFPLIATGATGERIATACPALNIERVKSGPLGGDQQIGALIATGEISAMIFFTDPLSAMPHDVDVKALTRLAVLYDVPFACNQRTADAVVALLGNEAQ
jgi:methylglyoxal synthase